MHSVEWRDLQDASLKDVPRHGQIPAVCLSMIGVDRGIQGRKLGAVLLVDALKRVLRLSGDIGVAAVILDAIDDEGRDEAERRVSYYRRFGFVPLPDRPLRMFLSMTTVRTLFGNAN